MTDTAMNPATLTPDIIVTRLRRQLEADAALGVLAPRPATAVDQVIADTVETLWRESRIKTYLPVLALRQARDTLRRLDDAPPATA